MREGESAFARELGGKRGPFVQVGEVGVAGATLTTGGTRRVGGLAAPRFFLPDLEDLTH
jgi:hypothetical protein